MFNPFQTIKPVRINVDSDVKYKPLTQKKNQLDLLRPFPPDLLKNLHEWFTIELTYTSNALEGNTLTRQETALVVEKEIAIGGKSLREHLEAVNHARALDYIHSLHSMQPNQLEQANLLHIHASILQGIDDNNAGQYRNIPVRIAGSRVILPNPRKVPDLMNEFIQWLVSASDLHPVELAGEAHYRLVTIHPFVDGNGRTARLLMNLLLMMHGYPSAIIRKEDRLIYLNALEKAQLGGAKDDYAEVIYAAVDRSLDIYLEAMQSDMS